jgi:GDP-L-fucose synthase
MGLKLNKSEKIYVAGHKGLVGSALVRNLQSKGFKNIVVRDHGDLELLDSESVREFFAAERPDYVFLAAAKVGGIIANNNYPADFITSNLVIQENIINSAYIFGVKRLMFLGSSCIYPRDCPQPMREEYLLTGPLEPTNRPYSLAKIAGIEMCWAYNRQYKTKYLAVMPTNLYGQGDNYHPENSHMLPALMRRLHEAKAMNADEAVVWGTGTPRRELMYSDDMADACVHIMQLTDHLYCPLLGQDRNDGPAPLVNIGVGSDLSIREIAEQVAEVVGYNGRLVFDPKKPDGTPQKLLDVSRLRALGWSAKTPLKEGLKLTYESYISNAIVE